MTTLRSGLAAALMLALAACGGGDGGGAERSAPESFAMAAPPAPVMAMDAMSEIKVAGSPAPAPQVEPDAGGAAPPQGRLIAYSYSRSFRVPTQRLEDLLNTHKAACESAGPQRCYVVSSNLSGLGTEYVSASLQIKAAPDWVQPFFAGLPEGLKPFNADLDGSNDWSEDLTTQIVDTDARLAAAKTLRSRLEALLRDRPGELKDLIEIERELARVQGEIDSTESVLAAMRLRVSMSDLALNYQPKLSPGSQSVWRPLGDAVGGFFGTFAESLAQVVGFTAGVLPWLLVVIGLGFFFLLILASTFR